MPDQSTQHQDWAVQHQDSQCFTGMPQTSIRSYGILKQSKEHFYDQQLQ